MISTKTTQTFYIKRRNKNEKIVLLAVAIILYHIFLVRYIKIA